MRKSSGEEMKFVLYTSILNQDQHDVFVIPQIIRTARLHNRIHQITGVLLFDGLNFTQYFEGEDHVVDRLLENILRDDRHKNIAIIATGHQHTRLYAEWKMGYIDTSADIAEYEHPVVQPELALESFKNMVARLNVE